MQQLLPVCHWPQEANWETRRFGHSGNWTEENSLFCFSTAIDIAIGLQGSERTVLAIDFYELHDDVVIVTETETEAVLRRGHWSSPFATSTSIRLQHGDTITCKATGHSAQRDDLSPQQEVDLNSAEWIAAARPRGAKIPKLASVFDLSVLWIRKSDVEITFQLTPERPAD
jgi:hypothetical protein